jgi:hypothetical protein
MPDCAGCAGTSNLVAQSGAETKAVKLVAANKADARMVRLLMAQSLPFRARLDAGSCR